MNAQEFKTLQTRRGFIRQAACAALGTSALTNTIRDLRFINAAMADTTVTDYKALVCIFLNGGNDANNLYIPTDPTEWQAYADIRSPVLAIPNADGSGATAQALNATNSSGHTYGIHPACKELADLFNAGKMATIFNVGTLVYPMTKTQYTTNSVARPPQLFSHADQVTQWQTSIPDQPPSTGWGGRCADLMDIYNPKNGATSVLSLCVSLAGANTFEVGGTVQQYAVSTGGVTSLNTFGTTALQTARTNTLNALLGIDKGSQQANMLANNYAGALDHSIATGSSLSTALTSTNSRIPNYWLPGANWSKSAADAQVLTPNGSGQPFTSSLIQQLRMVAKIIEAGYRDSSDHSGLGMKRQIFFVQVGGYDTHTGQTGNAGNTTTNNAAVVTGSQANLFAELSQAIKHFQDAMVAIGTAYGDPDFEKRVTSFTGSDFGRTFPSNSLGSDHGWGSHHMVVGGAVAGKKTYGKWPTLAVGGPDDTSTGRWIPTTSVDQFAATLAKWFGVDSTKMSTVFPNLVRFSAPDLGFMG